MAVGEAVAKGIYVIGILAAVVLLAALAAGAAAMVYGINTLEDLERKQ